MNQPQGNNLIRNQPQKCKDGKPYIKPIINPMINILKKQKQKQEINMQQPTVQNYPNSVRSLNKYGFIKSRHSSIQPFEIRSLHKRIIEFIKDKQQELQDHHISGHSPFTNKAIILFRRESAKELYYKIYNQHKARWSKQNKEKHEIYKSNNQANQRYKKMLETEASNASFKYASNSTDHIKSNERHFESSGNQTDTGIKPLPSIIPIAKIIESSV